MLRLHGLEYFIAFLIIFIHSITTVVSTPVNTPSECFALPFTDEGNYSHRNILNVG